MNRWRGHDDTHTGGTEGAIQGPRLRLGRLRAVPGPGLRDHPGGEDWPSRAAAFLPAFAKSTIACFPIADAPVEGL